MNGHIKSKYMKYYVLGLFLAVIITGMATSSKTVVNIAEAQPTIEAIMEDKVRVLEDEILAQLAQCESGGTQEPNAAILLDSNNAMSIGKFMWQINSVIHYMKILFDKKVTRQEAIEIAIDAHPEIRIDDLTRKVIFEDSKGIWNWANCAKKHGLEAQINLIKKLK